MRIIFLIFLSLISACGGGGGGGNTEPKESSSSSSLTTFPETNFPQITLSNRPITEFAKKDVPVITSAFIDVLSLAKSIESETDDLLLLLQVAAGTYTQECANFDGSASLHANVTVHIFEYKNCYLDGQYLDGLERVSISNANQMIIKIEWSNYKMTSNGDSETLTGYVIRSIAPEGSDEIEINIDIISNTQGAFSLRNALFHGNAANGILSLNNTATVSFEKHDIETSISGLNNHKLIIDNTNEGKFLSWYENGDEISESTIYVSALDETYQNKITSTDLTVKNGIPTIPATEYELDFSETFRLDVRTIATNDQYFPLNFTIINLPDGVSATQISAGIFNLVFDSTTIERHNQATIRVTGDGVNNYLDFDFKFYTGNDFDKDGTLDVKDSDDDNDNISDTEDFFPLDPRILSDADNDGVGNAADLFPYPIASICAEQVIKNCLLSKSNSAWLVYQNIIYFRPFSITLTANTRTVLVNRYDIIEKKFLEPMQVPNELGLFSSIDGRVYFTESFDITYIDLNTFDKKIFVTNDATWQRVQFFDGQFVGVLIYKDDYFANSYKPDGTLIMSKWLNNNQSIMPYFYKYLDLNHSFEYINSDGNFESSEPYPVSNQLPKTLSISPNQQYIYVGNTLMSSGGTFQATLSPANEYDFAYFTSKSICLDKYENLECFNLNGTYLKTLNTHENSNFLQSNDYLIHIYYSDQTYIDIYDATLNLVNTFSTEE